MLHHLHSPTSTATTTTTTAGQNPDNHPTTNDMFYEELDMDSNSSTPYVSAPSSPGRNAPPPIPGFYYSAPSSPMHFIISTAAAPSSQNPSISPHSEASPASSTCSFEFDFSTRLTTTTNGTSATGPITMTSADELFFNGQIRPMNVIDDAPFDGDESGVTNEKRGRAAKYRDRSRRRTRSMSPERTMTFDWQDDFETEKNEENMDNEGKGNDGIEGNESEGLDPTTTTTPIHTQSGSSSRSSSVGGSKRWVFLKEFLYRSKSEGRNNGHKFWGSLSFSPVKDKIKIEKFLASKITSNNVSSKEKIAAASEAEAEAEAEAKRVDKEVKKKKKKKKKTVNGVGKRRMPPSAHELHYTVNRAQAEEMKKKTFLPYRQGLLGCLGFSSKSYGAMNGFARTLNPVSSR